MTINDGIFDYDSDILQEADELDRQREDALEYQYEDHDVDGDAFLAPEPYWMQQDETLHGLGDFDGGDDHDMA